MTTELLVCPSCNEPIMSDCFTGYANADEDIFDIICWNCGTDLTVTVETHPTFSVDLSEEDDDDNV